MSHVLQRVNSDSVQDEIRYHTVDLGDIILFAQNK